MKVLKSQKSQLVEQRVALKTQPLTKEVSDLWKDFSMAQTELRNVSIRNDTPNKRKVYTNEDLTKTREQLSYECRKLKKVSKSEVSRTCLFNGNVFTLDDQENGMGETCSDDLKNEIRSLSR